MCMNGLLVIMAFGPLFGLWPSSFFVSSILSRCIVAFLLLDLFVVLNNATCSVRARAFGASFLLVPDLLM